MGVTLSPPFREALGHTETQPGNPRPFLLESPAFVARLTKNSILLSHRGWRWTLFWEKWMKNSENHQEFIADLLGSRG